MKKLIIFTLFVSALTACGVKPTQDDLCSEIKHRIENRQRHVDTYERCVNAAVIDGGSSSDELVEECHKMAEGVYPTRMTSSDLRYIHMCVPPTLPDLPTESELNYDPSN